MRAAKLQPVAVLISPLQRARSAVQIATTWISVSAAAIAIPAVVPMAVRQNWRWSQATGFSAERRRFQALRGMMLSSLQHVRRRNHLKHRVHRMASTNVASALRVTLMVMAQVASILALREMIRSVRTATGCQGIAPAIAQLARKEERVRQRLPTQ